MSHKLTVWDAGSDEYKLAALEQEVARLRAAIEHAMSQLMPATDAHEILRVALQKSVEARGA